MSGLCGWFSREPGAVPIAQMAAPLTRPDQPALRTGAHSVGAVALAAGLDCGSLYHEDGLLIAHWGEHVDALARLWRAHGPRACAALAGQFTFALIDERRGEALLAVDRCATRPLYYQLVGRTLVFATSTDALVRHPGAGREVDPQALYHYLYFQAVPGSIYRAQRRLAPGEYVHLHGGRLERTRYWRLRFNERQPGTLAGLKDELIETLQGAVANGSGQHHVGVMLGGGPASAGLAGLLRAAGGGPVPSYTVGIGPLARGAFEHARTVARLLGTTHHERLIGPSEAADAIGVLAAAFDQPCGDPQALAAYYCALLARENGTHRLLAGQGAAELFGRRAYYARQLRLGRYESLPSALRQLVLEPLLFGLARRVRRGPLAAAREHIRQSMLPLPARLRHANLLDGYGAASVFDPGFLALVDATAPAASVEQGWWLAQARHPVNRMIALDLLYRLGERALPALLRGADMAGVELALPYLNDAVLAFAARLDPVRKVDGAAAGALLRSALGTNLPRRALQERGYGLSAPVGHWLLADQRFRNLAFDSLSGLRGRGIVRTDFIDELLSRRLAEDPARHGRMVWLLMMLEQWFAQRRVAVPAALDGARQVAPAGPPDAP
jgi:asparagine synthase (glutamine-hydrolysing)